jgi:hypothetical protein
VGGGFETVLPLSSKCVPGAIKKLFARACEVSSFVSRFGAVCLLGLVRYSVFCSLR